MSGYVRWNNVWLQAGLHWKDLPVTSIYGYQEPGQTSGADEIQGHRTHLEWILQWFFLNHPAAIGKGIFEFISVKDGLLGRNDRQNERIVDFSDTLNVI